MAKKHKDDAPWTNGFYFLVFDGSCSDTSRFATHFIAINSQSSELRTKTVEFTTKKGYKRTALVFSESDINVEKSAEWLKMNHIDNIGNFTFIDRVRNLVLNFLVKVLW